ncbi:DUF1266 domain-containing protein [Maribacter sp. 2-571]|uniref:DUF1266 domain-containing protein n=1 Tax=Maribacter sp. 2-571 TaxID=3417569 RepID=UPI003D330A52
MKVVYRVFLFVFASSFLLSCSERSDRPDSVLKGFMLAGPYIVKSYGGKAEIETYMGYDRSTDEEETIALHKKTWIFFFTEAESKICVETLSDYWDITDKKGLTETLDGLRDEPYTFKAWDYARLVNNAALGYGAGYLTKEEAQAYVDQTLVLAQQNYPDWKTYFGDFNKGRKEWNPTSPDLAEFNNLVNAIQSDDNSIYKYLPLKD